MVELTDEQLLVIAEEAIHADDIADAHAEGYPLELSTVDLLSVQRAAIAADRAARGGVALQAFIESQRPLDPEVAAALTPEALWDLYEESPGFTARPQPTAEALRAAFAAWFKAEQHIPPSPAAARTAAAFTLAVLRGEVEL